MNFILSIITKLIASVFLGWKRDADIKNQGAAEQREVDRIEETKHVEQAQSAGEKQAREDVAFIPAAPVPDSVLNDPANRRRKRT